MSKETFEENYFELLDILTLQMRRQGKTSIVRLLSSLRDHVVERDSRIKELEERLEFYISDDFECDSCGGVTVSEAIELNYDVCNMCQETYDVLKG